jgi:hypothetical protein
MKASLSNGPIFRGLDVVAAIMPEAMGSGKQKAGAAGMPMACNQYVFPQSGMLAPQSWRA